uniref:Uncharacterized protein n=1 Tax=Anguilla anguilla TaxID=7936 RepID=A0A0E9ST62_ANGAN
MCRLSSKCERVMFKARLVSQRMTPPQKKTLVD